MYDPVVRAGALRGPMTSGRGDLAVGVEPIAPVGSRRVHEEPLVPIDPTGFVVIPGGVAPECRYNMRFGQVVTEPQQYSAGAPLAAPPGTEVTFASAAASVPPTVAHRL